MFEIIVLNFSYSNKSVQIQQNFNLVFVKQTNFFSIISKREKYLPIGINHKVSVGQIYFRSFGHVSAIEKFWQVSLLNTVNTVVIKPGRITWH